MRDPGRSCVWGLLAHPREFGYFQNVILKNKKKCDFEFNALLSPSDKFSIFIKLLQVGHLQGFVTCKPKKFVYISITTLNILF